MKEMLIDTPCFRRFADIDMIDNMIPDETTILNFRHQPEESRIAEQILERVNQSLSKKGAMLREDKKRDAFKDCESQLHRAMKPGQLRVLPETAEGRPLDLMETAKAHAMGKAKHP